MVMGMSGNNPFDREAFERQRRFAALGNLGGALMGLGAGRPDLALAAMQKPLPDPRRAMAEAMQMEAMSENLALQRQRQQAMREAVPALVSRGVPEAVAMAFPEQAAAQMFKTPEGPKHLGKGAFMDASGNVTINEDLARHYQNFTPRTNVDVLVEGSPQYGPVEKGWRMVMGKDEAGNQVVYQEPVAGSPAAREMAAEAEKQAARAGQTAVEGDLVNQEIGEIRQAQKESVLGVTGVGGTIERALPGTPARDVANSIDFLKDRVSLAALQQLRNNSPTGGALGNVSDAEGERLASAYGRLSQSVGTDKFNRNLDRFETAYNQVVHNRNPDGSQYRKVDEPAATTTPTAPRTTPPPDASAEELVEFYGSR